MAIRGGIGIITEMKIVEKVINTRLLESSVVSQRLEKNREITISEIFKTMRTILEILRGNLIQCSREGTTEIAAADAISTRRWNLERIFSSTSVI
jgi:hypothetical protein